MADIKKDDEVQDPQFRKLLKNTGKALIAGGALLALGSFAAKKTGEMQEKPIPDLNGILKLGVNLSESKDLSEVNRKTIEIALLLEDKNFKIPDGYLVSLQAQYEGMKGNIHVSNNYDSTVDSRKDGKPETRVEAVGNSIERLNWEKPTDITRYAFDHNLRLVSADLQVIKQRDVYTGNFPSFMLQLGYKIPESYTRENVYRAGLDFTGQFSVTRHEGLTFNSGDVQFTAVRGNKDIALYVNPDGSNGKMPLTDDQYLDLNKGLN